MSKKKKRPLTLLEIMIVIFLIGIIGSVIGYNMKGSLDEGKAFKTEQAMSRIREILLLEVAGGATLEEVVSAPKNHLEHSGLVDNADKLLKDGWGTDFKITVKNHNDVRISSERYHRWLDSKNKKLGKATVEEAARDEE